MLPVPFVSSYMVSATDAYRHGKAQGQYYLIADIQRRLAAEMADKMAAEITKNITIKEHHRPDMNGIEYQMRYEPPDYYTYTSSSSCDFTSNSNYCTVEDVPKKPVERSFSQWYRELKSEIDRWLN